MFGPPRSGKEIIEEALSVRGELNKMLKDKSTNKKSTDLFHLEKFNLESEIQDYSICPDHLLSEKMAMIEARIRKLEGLSPLVAGGSSVVLKDESDGDKSETGVEGTDMEEDEDDVSVD
ncbi:hypothetical protein U1Q18_032712 [Sarracenia purpurea var. burkii]